MLNRMALEEVSPGGKTFLSRPGPERGMPLLSFCHGKPKLLYRVALSREGHTLDSGQAQDSFEGNPCDPPGEGRSLWEDAFCS